jgi:hypothetical protein
MCSPPPSSSRYTGAACESCLASFYPTASRACIPQYIAGRTIFTPIDPQQPELRPWALVVAALLAASLLITMCVTLWNWLVRGIPPKTQLDTVLRKFRALVPVSWSRRAKGLLARRAAAVSARLLEGGSLAQLVLPGGGSKAHKEERVSLLMEVSEPQGSHKGGLVGQWVGYCVCHYMVHVGHRATIVHVLHTVVQCSTSEVHSY